MKKRRILYSLFILCAVAVALSVGLTLAKYIATLNGTPFKVHIDAHKTYYTYAVLDADTGELSIRDRKAVVANGKALKKDENKTYLVDRDGTYEYGANGIVYTLPTSNGYGTTTPGQSIAAGLSLDDANDGWTMVHNGYGGDVGAKTVSVVFEDTVSLQGDLRELFQGWPLLERIDMAKADLSEVTGMFKLFDHCQLLEEIILAPDADLRKVASMEKMFYGLSSLTSLTLPTTLELDSVTTMQYMFTGCTALTSITVPDIIAPNLTNMSSMFAGESNVSACDGLQSVTFGIIHAEKLETMASMFYHCSALETVVFGKEAATPDLIQYITPNLQYMNDMFRWCEQLSSITFDQSFDTSNVTSMSGMFNNCKALRVLDLKAFDTSQLQSMSSMFSWSGLREIDLTSFNTANVKYMNNMFETCTALTTLKWNADTFTTGNVKNMNKMFNACSALTTLDVSHFDTKNVTDMANMFSGTKYALKELDLTGWNTSKVTNMSGMFDSCYSISVYDLSSFDTSQVADMSRMFYDNKAVTKIIVSENFVTDQVTSSGSMFYMPYATTKPFYGGNRTQWVNTNPTDKTYACIDGILVDGKSMPGYFTAPEHEHSFAADTVWTTNDDATCIGACAVYGEPASAPHTLNENGVCTKCGYGKQVYAVYDSADHSLRFYRQETVPASSGTQTVYKDFIDKDYTGIYFIPWTGVAKSIKIVGVMDYGIQPVSMSYWFAEFTSMESCDVSKLDVSNVTSFNSTFMSCTSLTTLDLSAWNTSKATDMSQMFAMWWEDHSLTTIIVDPAEWKTPSTATDMFSGSTKLVGGAGTTYSDSYTNGTYARVDGGTGSGNEGYFTAKPAA